MKKSDGLSPKVKILYFHLWFCNIPEKVTMQEMFPTAPHIATIIWNVATDNGAVHPLNGNTCAIPHNTILILTNSTPSVQNRNIVWKSSLLRLEFNILSVEFSINLKFSISASLKSYFIEWLQGKIYFGESNRILYCIVILSIQYAAEEDTWQRKYLNMENTINFTATENENECIYRS